MFVLSCVYSFAKIYTTIILPVVLCWCDTRCFTLREEQVLRVFKSRVLKKVFGLKRDEITAEWRRLHNEKLLICTSDQI